MTEDELIRSRLSGLLGAGFCFSQVEDYDLAEQWAARAYQLGREDAEAGQSVEAALLSEVPR